MLPVAPLLQEYEPAPFAVRVALDPWHIKLLLMLTLNAGGLITLTLSVCVSTHPLLLPLTVYTVLMLGLTTIKELVDPELQL